MGDVPHPTPPATPMVASLALREATGADAKPEVVARVPALSSPDTSSAAASSAFRPTRGICKTCRKRRKVLQSSGLCSECAGNLSSRKSSHSYYYDASSTASQSPEASLTLSQVSHRRAQQMQMLAKFVEDHFPPAWTEVSTNLSYVQLLPTLDLSSPILSRAVDTVCFAYLGTHHSDDRLVHASQSSYGNVLASLKQAIGNSSATRAFSQREVITSILLVSLFDGMPAQDSHLRQGHFPHLLGAVQYAKAKGQLCLDPDEAFDASVLQSLRFQSLIVGVAKRKRVKWSNSPMFALPGAKEWFGLVDQLPSMLEVTDILLSKPSDNIAQHRQRLASLCGQLELFQARLHKWVNAGGHAQEIPGILTAVHVTDIDAFNMELEEHCYITSSPTFTDFVRFAVPQLAFGWTLVWLLSLVANATILRILHYDPAIARLLSFTGRDVAKHAARSASDLCRCVYYYASLKPLACAQFIQVFIGAARAYFEESGAIREMGWCQACLIATGLRVERLQRIRPSLCRVGDLVEPLAASCRYKSFERASSTPG